MATGVGTAKAMLGAIQGGQKWRVLLAFGLALILTSLPVRLGWADAESVIIVRSGDSPAYDQVLNSVRTSVRRHRSSVALKEIDYVSAASKIRSLPRPNLVVAIGLRAALAVRDAKLRYPTLYTLLPRATLRQVLKSDDPSDGPASGLHIDEPVARQLDLLVHALPDRRRVGVLLGPTSANQTDALKAEAHRRGLRLTLTRISTEAELIPALRRLLDQSDVLLAIADPLVYNRYTIQAILLTTYRRGIPVVAFSEALVRAGATMAVYSTPRQVGRQIGETVAKFLASPARRLPRPSGPRYFSVAINQQVAQSLGIRSLSEQALGQALHASPTTHP